MRQRQRLRAESRSDVNGFRSKEPGSEHMPLQFGKIGAFIALLTIAAFVLWLLWTSFFASEDAAEEAERTGAVELSVADGATV